MQPLSNIYDYLRLCVTPQLDAALAAGSLVLSGPVSAELMAAPERSEAFLDKLCNNTGIDVEFDPDEEIWGAAGPAFPAYAADENGNVTTGRCAFWPTS